MGKTSIEWCEFSINPIRARNKATGRVGHFCEKISPGCGHCYASDWNEDRFGTKLPYLPVWRDSVEIFLDEGKLKEVERRKKPTTYFWCDMTDIFFDAHPDAWLDQCFATMARTPHHTHQVLTKRAGRMAAYLTAEAGARVWGLAGSGGLLGESQPWPQANVWLGVSVENQEAADERILHLLKIPAAVRFLSVEPLLESVDLSPWLYSGHDRAGMDRQYLSPLPGTDAAKNWHAKVDWVIVGGESGHDARPCQLDWIRSIRDQCEAAGVACFIKQLGACASDEVNGIAGRSLAVPEEASPLVSLRLRDPKGGDMSEWPDDLRVREFPETHHA